MKIRRATIDDAGAIASIINRVVDEGKLTSLKKFTKDEEERIILSMREREAIFVAVEGERVVGFQGVFMFAEWSDSMNHVCNVLTMILPEYRRMGMGKRLAEHTFNFARESGYEKISTYILNSNEAALGYYQSLGFKHVGLWSRQAKFDGDYYDDVIVELFL